VPGALGAPGLQAVMTADGPTAADVSRPDAKPVLGPTLTPGATAVMATRQAHNAVGAPQAPARRGARRRTWPPSAPGLAHLAPWWSAGNTGRRTVKARTRPELHAAVAEAVVTVRAAAAWNWCTQCGYPAQ
jgi:hypothetical protein